jgi:hypothetical protein
MACRPIATLCEALLAKIDWKRFADQEDVVFDLSWQDITEAVARYIELHPDAFAP